MNGYGVIFDMDGVLVDSYQAHYESWRLMARERGLDMTPEQFAATFGKTSRDIIRDLWGQSVGDDEVPQWDRLKEAHYRDIIGADFPEMKGVGDLLAALAGAGFALAIGSSGPPENVAAVLGRLRNADLFRATVSGKEVVHGKPDPQVFLLAAGKLGLPPGRCAVIEDAPVGVQAALRAGMTAIAITGTVDRQRLAAAHLVVDSLDELTPKRISDLLGSGG